MKRFGSLLALGLALALFGCSEAPRKEGGTGGKVGTVGFMPKLTGIPYFSACRRGAEEAARELGIKLVYDGPTHADATEQTAMLDQWIASGDYDCICVACNDPKRLARVLKRAQKKGILVVTYDADAQDGREFFVNQATYEAVAEAMVDAMAQELDLSEECQVGILTSSIQAPNQSEWAKRMRVYAARKYPNMKLLDEVEHGEDRGPGIEKAKAMIQANPKLKGIIGLTSVAVPAAAEAVRQLDRKGKIKVTGVSTPKDMRDYLKDGTVKTVILWNPVDLGYLTVHVAALARAGKVPRNGVLKKVGRLANIEVKDGTVILGPPLWITKENVDKFDF